MGFNGSPTNHHPRKQHKRQKQFISRHQTDRRSTSRVSRTIWDIRITTRTHPTAATNQHHPPNASRSPPSLSPHLNRLPQLHHGMCQALTLPLHFRTFYERVRMTVGNSTSANMVDSRSFPLHGEMRVNFCPRCRLLLLRTVLRCRHKACLL